MFRARRANRVLRAVACAVVSAAPLERTKSRAQYPLGTADPAPQLRRTPILRNSPSQNPFYSRSKPFSVEAKACPPWRVGCDSLNLLQATRLPPQQSVDKTKAPGGFLLAALVSVGWVVSLGLLRLEQSFNDRTINRGHSDPVALIGCFWCLPVLDELVASSVIPQGG